jgi:HTH-type transcriptional regulator/antitoxin HigA
MSASKALLYEYRPEASVAPGGTLHEWLAKNDMSQVDFARRTGLSAKHISQVINAVAGISPDVALAFESVTGIPARYWNQLESNFRTQNARAEEDAALANEVQVLRQFPVKEVFNRLKRPVPIDPVQQLRELLRFFSVASVDALLETCLIDAKLRTASAFAPNEAALASWLRLTEIKAQSMKVEPFNAEECEKAIRDFRHISTIGGTAWWDELEKRCASVGIALVLEEEIPKCRVNGATKWLTPTKAMIALSLRHRRHDTVWFTFFHELGHLLRHNRKEIFVDGTGSQVAADLELDADRFASRTLIPPEYEAALGEISTQAGVKALALELDIDPSIVVGRMQHEKIIPFNQWVPMIRTYSFPTEG